MFDKNKTRVGKGGIFEGSNKRGDRNGGNEVLLPQQSALDDVT
jgi:hypothetical protein